MLGLLAAGRSNDAIARELFLSGKTVRNVVSSSRAPRRSRRSSPPARPRSASACSARSRRPRGWPGPAATRSARGPRRSTPPRAREGRPRRR
ncbi:LuxR C-terminal-related transcriptional regulator [Xylanimonas sp. McL0601]|uniref:LuxR C-terminal-related transcriptional regulator n=1 Tax=Xylanimonas sp. McL0601 TaxID=3414739 RepID=UPI003CE8A8B2